MPHGESNLLSQLWALLPAALMALIGGVLDFMHAVMNGSRQWSVFSFIFHLALAFFFGAVVSSGVVGLGYDVSVAGAAAGAAGFLNIRLVDLLMDKMRGQAAKAGES